ncbi:hypothetical protein DEM27_30720 [Metarhizobium album]|uniref:Uncharacterized protein n=2 Tax=Rhizobiaceae TaxID=82115 RepID=A0A2U2DGW1_9HYPH|nr:hypothetical protein [Rhizobium album]PWE52540.1 hypothetical protein DEM27_30720 [Rhizobium album]
MSGSIDEGRKLRTQAMIICKQVNYLSTCSIHGTYWVKNEAAQTDALRLANWMVSHGRTVCDREQLIDSILLLGRNAGLDCEMCSRQSEGLQDFS